MADYTEWSINDYLPGKPYTSAKAISQHENLDAVAEGAPNAPRIQAEAMQGSVAGDTVLFGTGGTGQVFGNGTVWPAQFRATTDCEVRVKGEYRRDPDTDNVGVTFTITKNGSTALSESTTSTTWQTSASIDISLVAGDLILVEGFGGSVSAPDGSSRISSIQMRNITYNTTSDQRSVGGI